MSTLLKFIDDKMEKLQFDYSYKNVPVPHDDEYKMQLMEKIELVIKRMRWKAHFFEENDENEETAQPETYEIKSLNCPPPIKGLTNFENDLFNIVKSIKFRKSRNQFQTKLKNDIKTIKTTTTTLTFADKTLNLYKLTKDEYNKLLNDSITSTYKKVNENVHERINGIGKGLIKEKAVINRMLTNGKNNCFITLKDHKENFQNNPKVRLINPAKNEIGRISKNILDKINKELITLMNINQWKDTSEVIEWFKNIPEKNKHNFIVFDIKDFYPSISKKLLTDALNFAKSKVTITEEETNIVFHARKSLLFNKDQTWMKKGGELFDVTMGAFDGAEICELVGIFLQHQISNYYNIGNIGLYRDDGLAVFKNTSGPESERIKKKLQSIFKDNGLDLVIECNKKIVDYLDVTLNLNNGTYKPYCKPDNKIQYINIESNHPPNIINQIPKTIEKDYLISPQTKPSSTQQFPYIKRH